MQVKPFIFLKGLATYIPGARRYFCSSSGGTVSARYCYAVWMRHLVKACGAGLGMRFDKIAELGPGDSLGIGLCAVLCGAKEYYALDAKPHACSERNECVLEELISMLSRREAIPDATEFPGVAPVLKGYSFPRHILTDAVLADSLHPDRLAAIRKALADPGSVSDVSIAYIAPWQNVHVKGLAAGLDLVFSQAVMEHVDDIEGAYASMYKYLRSGGVMSHTIDYTSHGYTTDWNGHWAVSDALWQIIRGRRPYFINRHPHSKHIQAIEKAGFKIVAEIKRQGSPLPRNNLRGSCLGMSDDDLQTSGSFIQAEKPAPVSPV